MNIYIRIEVFRREFEGRLWLAMVAAERGHRVLLGKLRHRDFVGSAPDLFPPGVFHDKSLTPRPSRFAFQTGLAERGFVLTSQDEEHGLTLEDMVRFLSRRFSAESLQNARASFAWGPQEVRELKSLFPLQADQVIETGSPRVDLWRPDLAYRGSAGALAAEGIEAGFVLIASSLSPFGVNPTWMAVGDARGAYFNGLEDAREFEIYRRRGQAYFFIADFIHAIRSAALALPHMTFVIRPHPFEDVRAWPVAIGPVPNVRVVASGSISPWIQHAKALVHNGSTTAIEAAVRGVPVIAFDPPSAGSEQSFVNHLGARAASASELRDLLSETDWVSRQADESSVILRRRIGALEGDFAADRIVSEWETLDDGTLSQDWRLPISGQKSLRSRLAAVVQRASSPAAGRDQDLAAAPRMDSDHKFLPLDARLVAETARHLAEATGRFSDVRVAVIGERLIEVRSV